MLGTKGEGSGWFCVLRVGEEESYKHVNGLSSHLIYLLRVTIKIYFFNYIIFTHLLSFSLI